MTPDSPAGHENDTARDPSPGFVRPGALLAGRYRVGDPIGRGGMSTVYRGHDELLRRDVAIKVLGPLGTTSSGSRQEFLGEARAAAALLHPNIAGIFDVGVHGEERYIIMEFVAGGSLLELIQSDAPLQAVRAIPIGVQIADALEYGHRHGIIHCDVKPQNVLLDETGRPKLVDFGISRSIAATGALTDTITGTAGYIAPEQLLGERLDGRVDIYALGCVLYEMLAGALPFESTNLAALATQRLARPPTPIRQKNPRVSPAVAETVMRALERDRHARYGSAREFSEALAASVSGSERAPRAPLRSSLTEVVTAYPPGRGLPREEEAWKPPRRPARMIWPLALLVLGILIVAGALAAVELPSLLPGGAGPPIAVPDVNGQSVQQATQRVSSQHLSVEVAPRDTSGSATCTGTVLEQNPSSGTQVAAGGSVLLTVSENSQC